MKLLITLFMCCLFYGILYPQGGGDPEFPDIEFNIQIQNVPNSTITFEFIPLGANWAFSTGCNLNLYNNETTYISSLTADETGYVVCIWNGYEYRFIDEGNYTSVTACAQSSAGLKALRNGFYRINIKENGQLKTYAYFDWRHKGFPITSCQICSGANDMTIRYDGDEEELWFWNDNNVLISNQDPHLKLVPGQILYWADWNCSSSDESLFWWSQGLVLNSENNNPRITWGPHPSFQTFYFKVYRAVSMTPLSKPELSASLIATVSRSTYEYTDGDIFISTNGEYIYYFVKAYNGSYSGRSNIVVARGGFYKENISGEDDQKLKFNLSQNYPNPFNPSSVISFRIATKERVLLRVFDVLGKEVARLVDEIRNVGTYDVEFNAAGLPSGIYFYELQTGKFKDTKKMILLR